MRRPARLDMWRGGFWGWSLPCSSWGFLWISLQTTFPTVGRVLDDPPQYKAAVTLLSSSLSSSADVGLLVRRGLSALCSQRSEHLIQLCPRQLPTLRNGLFHHC